MSNHARFKELMLKKDRTKADEAEIEFLSACSLIEKAEKLSMFIRLKNEERASV